MEKKERQIRQTAERDQTAGEAKARAWMVTPDLIWDGLGTGPVASLGWSRHGAGRSDVTKTRAWMLRTHSSNLICETDNVLLHVLELAALRAQD